MKTETQTVPAGEQPAFPAEHVTVERYASGESKRGAPGMSLRDWFAGQALVGYIASHAADGIRLPRDEVAARHCYEYADAMRAARDVPTDVPL